MEILSVQKPLAESDEQANTPVRSGLVVEFFGGSLCDNRKEKGTAWICNLEPGTVVHFDVEEDEIVGIGRGYWRENGEYVKITIPDDQPLLVVNREFGVLTGYWGLEVGVRIRDDLYTVPADIQVTVYGSNPLEPATQEEKI